MTFVVDGYTPPAKEIAFEQGVTFEYEMPFGTITIRSKMAGRENAKFRLAMQNHQQWADRRKALGNAVDRGAEAKFVGLVHDTLVLSWATTVKSEGEAIPPTRESFIALMTSQACSKVISIFLEDAGDEKHFRALTADEMGKSSEVPLDGTSDGLTSESGS